jgi:four helix bundle protein
MPKPLRSHRDLKVYQTAMMAQRQVFQLTQLLPDDERFEMKPQWRRCSRGVCAAIGEGWRRRRYPAHWISKLSDAESEAAESQVWAEIARDCGYVTENQFDEIFDMYDKVIAQLVLMATHPTQWHSPTVVAHTPLRPSTPPPKRPPRLSG